MESTYRFLPKSFICYKNINMNSKIITPCERKKKKKPEKDERDIEYEQITNVTDPDGSEN